jgi:hypothetical protein
MPQPGEDPRRPRGREVTLQSQAEREQEIIASKMLRRGQPWQSAVPSAPAAIDRAPAADRSIAGPAPAPRAGGAPGIAVQVIVYSEVPSQRMAFIDGRRFAEGDMIDGDTTLERINEDGIVVRRGGVRYVVLSRKD